MDISHISYSLKIPKSIVHILHIMDIISYNVSFLLYFTGLHPSFPILPSPWGESTRSSPLQLIKSKLPVREYSEISKKYGIRKQDKELICAVCLNAFRKDDEVRELGNCAHVFHTCCIDEWTDIGKITCPLCRLKILPLKKMCCLGSFSSLMDKLW